MSEDLIGPHSVERLMPLRQMATDGFAAANIGHHIVAFLELDVTEALVAIEALQRRGERMSLFAFLLRAVAQALAEHPRLNSVRDGSKVVLFSDVDINIPIEVDEPEGPVAKELTVRRASTKSVAAIYAEIERARERHASSGTVGDEDAWTKRMMPLYLRLPRFARVLLMRSFMKSAWTVKRRFGTTLFTSVSKFATAPGFVLPLLGSPLTTLFALGSVVEKPVVRESKIVARSIAHFTAAFNHDLVDGGPASRFVRTLQAIVENQDQRFAQFLNSELS